MIGQYPPDSIQRDSSVYCSGLVLPGIEQAGARVTIYLGTGRTSANRLGLLPDFAAAIDRCMANTGQPFLDTLGDDDAEVQKQPAEALSAFHISKKLFSDRLRPRRGHPRPSSHD